MSFDRGTSTFVNNNTYFAPVSTANTIWTTMRSNLISAVGSLQPNSLDLIWTGCEVVVLFAYRINLPDSREMSLAYLYSFLKRLC